MIKMPLKSKRIAVPLLMLLAAIFVMIMLRECSHPRGNAFDVKAGHSLGDTLDVAIEMSRTCYAVRGDSVYGDAYEHLQAISAKHGVPMKFHPFVPLSYALSGLDDGAFDLVVGSMPATAEIRSRYLTTDPLLTDREVLVQLRDTVPGAMVERPSDLAGKEVWIASDSPFATRLRNLASEIGDTIYVHSEPGYSSEYLVILTAKGEIPRAVVNESLARKMQEMYPEIDITVAVSFTQFQSWLLRGDRTGLRDSINSWIAD